MASHADQLLLQGVVLCCTSLSQDVRPKVADAASQMGAAFKLDLTWDVTHLIVGSITTPKYRYVAKERPDIKVLRHEWIEAVRQEWMTGGEVNVEELEYQYRLPVFFELKICITGIQDMDKRNDISETVKRSGAEYHPDLTKAVTHLIAEAPTGAKYTHAKQWGINIVSLKWLEDSLRRGMALEEALYDPVLPLEEQGTDAFRTVAKPRPTLGKRARDGELQASASHETSKRKMRRTASTRLHSQSQDMWQDMSARESESKPSEADQWKDETETPSREQSVQPQRPSLEKVQVRRSDVFSITEQEPEGLFAGRYILIRGFPREKISRLRQFLEPNGACVVQSAAELEDVSSSLYYKSRQLLVPHALDKGSIELPEVPPGTELVTEWWVERCIHYKRFFEPAEDPLSRPLWDAKITAFAGMSVCTTGFSGVDFRQTAEAIKLMGPVFEEKLAQHASVLISGTETLKKEKAYYAAKHSIPVVSAAWLWECLRMKRRVAYDDYRVKLPAFDSKELVREPSTSSPAPSDMMERRFSGIERMKDEKVLKRLSNTRKKQATPSLALQATKPAPPSAARKPMPFVHEDEEDDRSSTVANDDSDVPAVVTDEPCVGDGAGSAVGDGASDLGAEDKPSVLQELSPNLSPRKASQNDEEDKQIEALKPTELAESTDAPQSIKTPSQSESKDLGQPRARSQEELTANLASLLQQQKVARQDSASFEGLQKRKNRPLGRSASGIGNRSASASAHSEHAAGSPGLPSEVSESVADGFSFSKMTPPPPGTQLGYETADAEAHRLLMEKRMKVKLQDEGTGRRVASVGTVKDIVDEAAGVGNRVRGRHRTK